MSTNNFARLASIDVSEHIEKKQNLSYLSWAWAVDRLMREDPAANWVFHEPQMFGQTMMVSCTVTAFGKPMTMQLPVMDHRNKAIANPDAFEVNKNMMRCLVKAIALHGLGLYIYAGEDLPADESAKQAKVDPGEVLKRIEQIQNGEQYRAMVGELKAIGGAFSDEQAERVKQAMSLRKEALMQAAQEAEQQHEESEA